MELKIIEILLLYGNIEEDFEDFVFKANEEGELLEIKEVNRYKVFQRIYLSLQEDEVELGTPIFKDIYNNLIAYFNENENFEIEQYLMRLSPELAQEVTTIIMDDEKTSLHNWEAQQIYVKQKDKTISQYVSETILTLRWFLVNKIIEEIKSNLSNATDSDNYENLSMVMDYSKLVNNFSNKLGRVMSRYS
ncbi:DNA primase [Flavobacterium psychrophilum]|nr:DNA primase [Flavobacterium psychrophilum]